MVYGESLETESGSSADFWTTHLDACKKAGMTVVYPEVRMDVASVEVAQNGADTAAAYAGFDNVAGQPVVRADLNPGFGQLHQL